MRGSVFDIRRFSTHDGEGIRTTVFLKGCPLSCVWCHNPEGISTHVRPLFFANRCIGCETCCRLSEHGGMMRTKQGIMLDASKQECWDKLIDACPSGAIAWDSRSLTADEAAEEVLKDKPFYKYGGGVTFSGGEPLMQADFVQEVLKRLKEEKIHTAVETALYVPTEHLEKTLPFLDQIYADMKIFDDLLHKKYIGVSNNRIKEHIRLILNSKKREKVIIRTPMIPGLTDHADNLAEIARFISDIYPDVVYELLNYNPLAQAKYHLVDREYYFKENPRKYSKKQMEDFAEIAKKNGVRHVISES